MVREFTKIGVVGLGTMGAGIAEVAARAGLAVVGVEQDGEWLARGRGHIDRSTARAVARGRLTDEQRTAIVDRLAFTTSLADLEDVDLVVEAVPERLDVKVRLFGELDTIVKEAAVLATNTSSLSVTAIAAATKHPERVVGMHFFNPAPVMKLVEVVHTVVSPPPVVAEVEALARALGKTPVVVGDAAGFIANRLLFGYLNQAAMMYESKHATSADVDTAMTRGAGFPIGPFALLDLIGLDTSQLILETIYAETKDRRYAAAPILGRLVAVGWHGRKTGRGISELDVVADEPAETISSAETSSSARTITTETLPTRVIGDVVEIVRTAATPVSAIAAARAAAERLGNVAVVCGDRAGGIVDALLYPYLNDAIKMVESGYARPGDIDTAMTLGCGFPKGPFELLDEVGLESADRVLRVLYDETKEPSLAPAPLLGRMIADGRGFR